MALFLVLLTTALAKLLSVPAASVHLPPWMQYALGVAELLLAGALYSCHSRHSPLGARDRVNRSAVLLT